MANNQYLKILKKTFKDFKFFEDEHYYEFKGERVGISVTKFIEQYSNQFNAEFMAEKVAMKNYKINLDTGDNLPQTIQDVLQQWDYKNKFACIKGKNGHNYAQCCWSKKKFEYDRFDDCDQFKQANSKIFLQGLQFYDDYKEKLEHLADEFVIGSEEYDIASCVDHLFVNKQTGGLVLVDYKTSNDIRKDNKYVKHMQVPLQDVRDNKLNHYFLQVSIYRYLIEKYTGLQIEQMFIVYMNEDIEFYEIINVPYLIEEVETILEWRKWKI